LSTVTPSYKAVKLGSCTRAGAYRVSRTRRLRSLLMLNALNCLSSSYKAFFKVLFSVLYSILPGTLISSHSLKNSTMTFMQTTNCSSLFIHLIFTLASLPSRMLYNKSLRGPGLLLILTLDSFKTKFLLIGLVQQLDKIQNCPLITTDSARSRFRLR